MRHPLLLALLPLLACSSGGGGGATPAWSQGEITALGSITVTGVAWSTDAAAVELDGASASPAALQLGMVVQVEGERDGEQGSATRVVYEPSILGPVSARAVALDGDGAIRRVELVVLGQTVVARAGATIFGAPVGIDTDLSDDLVEVSGFRAEDGRIEATRIDRRQELGPGAIVDVELGGVVEDLDADSFAIGPVVVAYDAGDLTQLPGGTLVAGERVTVNGSWNPGSGVLTATAIAPALAVDPGDAQQVALDGLVDAFVSYADFEVEGQPVDATRSVVRIEPTPISFDDGVHLLVDGRLDANGVLLPSEMRVRDADVILAAEIPVDGIDAAEQTLTLLGATVQVDSATRFQDGRDDVEPFGFDDLAVGDFVVVRGVQPQTSSAGASAVSIERRDPGPVELQAGLQGLTWAGTALPRNLTLLGVEVETDETTSFVGFPSPGEEAAYTYLYFHVGAPVEIEDVDDGDATSISLAAEVELVEEE